jgi:hypothetical protein
MQAPPGGLPREALRSSAHSISRPAGRNDAAQDRPHRGDRGCRHKCLCDFDDDWEHAMTSIPNIVNAAELAEALAHLMISKTRG